MPIVCDEFQNIRMLLNIEDETEGAFSNDELETLKELIDDIQPALRRAGNQFVLESAFRSAPDAILVADALGTIRKANPAAAQLLKCTSPDDLLQSPLASLFSSEAEARHLIDSRSFFDYTTHLVAHDGSLPEVLLDLTQLPEIVGGGQYIAIRDLASIRRLQELEDIGDFCYEVATQTATPLSLVKTWLQRLVSTAGDDHSQYNLARKALLQLEQVKTTLERMQLYDEERARRIPTDREPLDPFVELKLLLQEFPASEATRVVFTAPADPVTVIADQMQFTFMFKTIFAYLFRHLPPGDDSTIQVLAKAQERIRVEVVGTAPEEDSSSHEREALTRAKFQLALGEPLLHTFAASNGAVYRGRRYVNQQVIFEIDFESA